MWLSNKSWCFLPMALILLAWSCCETQTMVAAFAPARFPKTPSFCLFMGKGFSKGRNKQAELAQMMELAKKQRDPDKVTIEETTPPKDPDEIKQEEDRLLFAQLLAENQPVESEEIVTKAESKPATEAKNKPKIKVKALKRRKKASAAKHAVEEEPEEDVPLQEGDIAKRKHFEGLISLETSQPLGAIGAAQLVPWVPPYLSNYLLVLADPRKQSGDLRQSIQYLTSNVEPEILDNVICITADSNEETANWMKRANVDTTTRMFSDQKLEWMRSYSAVADVDRWSMSIFLFCTDGVIQKHLRQVDPAKASQLVTDLVQSINEK